MDTAIEFGGRRASRNDANADLKRRLEGAMAFELARQMESSGQRDRALALLQRSLESDPGQPHTTALLAWVQAQDKGPPPTATRGASCRHYAAELELLDRVLLNEPSYAQAYFFRGALWKLSGDLDKAGDDFLRACRLRPDDLDAQRELRLVRARRRRRRTTWERLFGHVRRAG